MNKLFWMWVIRTFCFFMYFQKTYFYVTSGSAWAEFLEQPFWNDCPVKCLHVNENALQFFVTFPSRTTPGVSVENVSCQLFYDFQLDRGETEKITDMHTPTHILSLPLSVSHFRSVHQKHFVLADYAFHCIFSSQSSVWRQIAHIKG